MAGKMTYDVFIYDHPFIYYNLLKYYPMDTDVKVNIYKETWTDRKFIGGPKNGETEQLPVDKQKRTHYEYGTKSLEDKSVDVMEYVYRLQADGTFLNTEVNGIIREYK